MRVKRSAFSQLVKWKDNPERKPLIIRGARQVGKTWLMKEFGQSCYDSFVYFNFDEEDELKSIFEANKNPQRIIELLSMIAGEKILPGETLVIFDEVQEVPRAMTSLKMFNEAAPEYDVLATGSALGIAMHPGFSFPVGKVSRLKLYPMSFVEFLYACKQYALAEMLESKDSPLINVMHDRVMTWLRYFMYTGGMPEIVEAFASTLPNPDFTAVRKLQNSLVSDYRDDFSKHVDMRDSPAVTTLRLNQVWDSIPSQLAKENKKFVYGVV